MDVLPSLHTLANDPAGNPGSQLLRMDDHDHSSDATDWYINGDVSVYNIFKL